MCCLLRRLATDSGGSGRDHFSLAYKVNLSVAASRQLLAIQDYIAAEGSPLAAQRHAQKMLNAIATLEHAPFSGRPAIGGTRELATVPPQVIRYRIVADEVFIIRIRHGARRPTE